MPFLDLDGRDRDRLDDDRLVGVQPDVAGSGAHAVAVVTIGVGLHLVGAPQILQATLDV